MAAQHWQYPVSPPFFVLLKLSGPWLVSDLYSGGWLLYESHEIPSHFFPVLSSLPDRRHSASCRRDKCRPLGCRTSSPRCTRGHVMVVCLAFLTDTVGPAGIGQAVGSIDIPMSIGLTVGPPLGGVIYAHDGY